MRDPLDMAQALAWPRGHGLALARRCLGWTIAAGGLAVCAGSVWRALLAMSPAAAHALLAGMVAAGATALGTLPVWLSQQSSERTRDSMMGFGAGVMLAASAFSLVVPALAAARSGGAGPWGAGIIVGLSMLLGALALVAMDKSLPHEHFLKGREGPQDPPGAAILSEPLAAALKRVWLFVFAITLHNVPEGLAIGVAYAGSTPLGASALATGIAIQDVPEGLVIAFALRSAGYGRVLSGTVGAASGLVEPVAAVAGALVMGVSASLLPWGLGFAAGAMLFVISHEIIPESHRQGHEAYATCGLMLGFVLMMLLDTALAA